MMLSEILGSQGSKYYDKNPIGTKEYLYLWVALDKFGSAQWDGWTGNEVFLKDVDAYYKLDKKRVVQWYRDEPWQKLQTLKRMHSELSWQDILENHFNTLPPEDRQKIDFLTLAKIVEDWERFDIAKRDLQSAFGDGGLKAYFLEGNGDNHLLKKEFWKAEHTWEVFENSDSDFERGYKQHVVYRAFLERTSFHHSDSIREMRGTICVKKDDLEKFLSGHKEESPQPSSPDINVETIVKFLETRGHVNPHFKLMLHYVHKGIPEKLSEKDFKKAFKNWIEQNGNTLVPELSKSQINDITDSRLGDISRQIK